MYIKAFNVELYPLSTYMCVFGTGIAVYTFVNILS
jgi:hypothetical protein